MSSYIRGDRGTRLLARNTRRTRNVHVCVTPIHRKATRPNRGSAKKTQVFLMTNLDDGRILFRAFDEFIIGQSGILVAIHVAEDLVDALETDELQHQSYHHCSPSRVYPHR